MDTTDIGTYFKMEHIEGIYYKSARTGQFYFSDETQADFLGPYDTLEEAKIKAAEYGRWLRGERC